MDKNKIEEQAKKIMDDFLSSLKDVDHLKYEVGNDRDIFMRTDAGIKEDQKFRERMLRNAPKTKDECIQAEKKKW